MLSLLVVLTVFALALLDLILILNILMTSLAIVPGPGTNYQNEKLTFLINTFSLPPLTEQ